MSDSIKNSLRTEKIRHKNELKNLISSNNNEIAKLKNEHEKKKADLKIQNTVEINSVLNEGEKKLLQVTDKNERTLRNLQESIELSKERARKEQERIEGQMNSKKEDQKFAYENHLARTKENFSYQLDDLEHQAQTELERINNKIKNKKSELSETSRNELSNMKQQTLAKKQMTKDLYSKKRLAEEDKYGRALTSLKKHHQTVLSREERNHQNILKTKQSAITQELSRVNKDGKGRLQELQKNHEQNYKNNYDRTQSETSNLLKRKEKIIQNFKQRLRAEGEIQTEKNKDSFYHYKELPARITELPEKDGYLVEVKIPKHEVKNVRLTAENRQISLFMDRKIKEEKNYQDGSQTMLNKVETLTSKVKVDEIVDPKQIKQTYQDGVLSFKIGLA